MKIKNKKGKKQHRKIEQNVLILTYETSLTTVELPSAGQKRRNHNRVKS